MKVGYVQFEPILGSAERNRREMDRLVSAHPEADLLVLPELCGSGYRFNSREEAWAQSEPLDGGPFAELLLDLSRRHQVLLVGGFCERDGDRLYNSVLLATPEGIGGHYRKLHLFWDEKDIFTPGDLGLPVFECRIPTKAAIHEERSADDDLRTGASDQSTAQGVAASGVPTAETVRLGLLICFDWQFPEAWRVLALKGAEIVCHPSNLVLPGLAQRAVPVLAMLNRVFAVTANRIGTERDLTFTGRSILASPTGDVLAEAPPAAEEVRILTIDPGRARDKAVTPRNDAHRDRRPEFYSELLRPLPKQP